MEHTITILLLTNNKFATSGYNVSLAETRATPLSYTIQVKFPVPMPISPNNTPKMPSTIPDIDVAELNLSGRGNTCVIYYNIKIASSELSSN